MKSPSTGKTDAKAYETELLNRRWLSEGTFEIQLTRPDTFDFSPGQRIRFIQDNRERDYSLVSAPSDVNIVLCLRNVKHGVFSPILAEATIGTRFAFTGPHGHFIFRASRRPAVFVATGTGIAPFVSMARSGVGGFVLLHGVRTSADLYYERIFRAAAGSYVPCLSRGSAVSCVRHEVFFGRVNEYIEGHLPRRGYDFYLSGRGEMIRDVTLLVDDLFPDSRVYSEIFF